MDRGPGERMVRGATFRPCDRSFAGSAQFGRQCSHERAWSSGGKWLRHSREMTLLCSPRVTQHHGLLGGFCRRTKPFCRGENSVSTLAAAAIQSLAFTTRTIGLVETGSLTRVGADEGKANRTPSAWMISLARFCPAAKSCSKSCS